jgi:hypothetical protein
MYRRLQRRNMASPSASIALMASILCPQCDELCVGPVILTCGHVSCRKCLRDHHHSECRLTCALCQCVTPLRRVKALTVLADDLGSDPVLVQLVNQHLETEEHKCEICENKTAEKLCHDCKQKFCVACSKAHAKVHATKDHVLQVLPMRNTSDTPTAVRPRTASSPASSDSIRNVSGDRPHTAAPNRWKQWSQDLVKQLETAASGHARVASVLDDLAKPYNG